MSWCGLLTGLVVGLFVGAAIGFFAIMLCIAAGEDDDREGRDE